MKLVSRREGASVALEMVEAAGPVSWRRFAALLVEDAPARRVLTDALAAIPFGAFAWECSRSSASTLDTAVEMVVVESPRLASTRADPSAFATPFGRDRGALVSTFENLGGDAVLVAPHPLGPPEAYGHLARFLREAPAAQVDALWAATGRALQARWAAWPDPVWLSTAGLGVPWLHVRLDDRPKYYRTRRLAG